MHLTPMEEDVLIAIAENQYADSPDSPVWSWAIVYETKITNKDQVSGVTSSLSKKGLVKSQYDGCDSTIWLTPAGVTEYKRIRR